MGRESKNTGIELNGGANDLLNDNENLNKILLDNLPCIALILKKGTREIVASNKAAQQIGAVPGKTCYETCADRDDRCPFCLAPELWETEIPQNIEVLYRGKYYEGIWVPLSDVLYVHYIFDITDRRKAEEKLHNIEWLLIKGVGDKDSGLDDEEDAQPYGDLTELNTNRLILDSVGKETLSKIIHDYYTLLETSAAIYERNGDYAFGLFTSQWCKLLDNASRELCGTDDNKKALDSGKWLCHESCWTDCAKISVEKAQPVDIECNGGIRLFAVPIIAGDEITGSVIMGYGDPPKAEKKLREIARRYKIPLDKLKDYSGKYDSRPKYIIELAKSRVFTTAKLLGEIIDRKKAQEALEKRDEQYRLISDNMIDEIWLMDMDMNVTFITQSIERRRGFKFEEFKNMHWTDHMTPESVEISIKELEKTLTPESLAEKDRPLSKTLDLEFNCKDGSTVWSEVTMSLIRDEEGRPTGFLGVARDIDERKAAQEALKKSEEKFRSLIEHIPDVAWTSDSAGKTTYISPNVKKIYGYTPEEIYKSGKDRWFGRIHSDDVNMVKKEYNTLMKKGTPLDIEYRIQRSDGEWIWLRDRSIGTYIKDGIKYADGVFTDITDRKKVEEDLVNIFNLSPEMICIGTADGEFIKVNPAFETILGYTEKEILELGWANLIHPDDIPSTDNELQKQIKGVTVQNFTNRFRCKDGSYKVFEWQATPVINGIIYAAARDITERKRAEERLNLLSTITEQTTDGIIVTDKEYKITYLNKAIENLYGYQLDEITGKTPDFMNVDPRSNEIQNSIYETVASGKTWTGTILNQRKDESIFSSELKVCPLFDIEGNISSYMAAVRDVTDRIEAEKALKKSEERYRALVQNIPGTVYRSNRDGTIEFINENIKDICGYDASDFIENKVRSFVSIMHEDDVGSVEEAVERSLRARKPVDVEYRIITRDGEMRWLHDIAQIVYDENGEIQYFDGVLYDITQKMIEDEERILVSNIMSNMSEGVYLITMDEGKIVWANPKFEEMFGYGPKEIIGKHVSIINAPTDKDPEEKTQKITGTIKETYGWSGEVENVKKDGTIFWNFANVSVFNHPKYGEVMVSVNTDITKQKEAQREIIKLAKFPAENPYPVMRIAKNGEILYNNPASKSLLKYWDYSTGKKLKGQWYDYVKEALKEKKIKKVEVDYGGRAHSLAFAPIADSAFVNIYGLDITERKQAEDALRESRELLHLALEGVHMVVYDWNVQINHTVWSEGAEEVLGFPKGVFGNDYETYLKWVHPDDIEPIKKRVEKALKDQEDYVSEYRVILPSGDIRWTSALGKIFRDGNGTPTRIAGTMMDITEQKKMTQELLQSKKLASVGKLAAGVAHELNNPLANISLISANMMKMTNDPEILKKLNTISKQGDMARDIVQSLLNFSRKIELDLSNVILNDMVAECVELISIHKPKQIKIIENYKKDLPRVKADWDQMRHVFTNIIENAMDAMPGGGNIGITTDIEDDGYASIRISDKGCGLSDDDLDSIFDPFFTTKEVGKGVGLGLSICHGIVIAHGGKIEVESEQGKGTTFKIKIPVG